MAIPDSMKRISRHRWRSIKLPRTSHRRQGQKNHSPRALYSPGLLRLKSGQMIARCQRCDGINVSYVHTVRFRLPGPRSDDPSCALFPWARKLAILTRTDNITWYKRKLSLKALIRTIIIVRILRLLEIPGCSNNYEEYIVADTYASTILRLPSQPKRG